MSKDTFGLRNWYDLYNKLCVDYGEYLTVNLNRDQYPEKSNMLSFKCLDCVLTSWHLIDWVHLQLEATETPHLGDLREKFFIICPEIQLLHDVANGMKHFELSRPQTQGTQIEYILVDDENDENVGNEEFTIVDIDGRGREMREVLMNVMDFWQHYYKLNRNKDLLV